MEPNKLLILLGPTASGKTRLAVRLADRLAGEIISADSRQVFSGMDIGTGKDLSEYQIQGKKVPYHLIDIRPAGDKYNVNEFKDDFYRVFAQLTQQNKTAILCGGTGMYIHSLLQNHEYTAVPVNEHLRNNLGSQDIASLRDLLSGYPAAFTAHADHSSAKRLIRAIEIADYLSKNQFVSPERPLIDPLVIGLTADIAKRRQNIYDRLDARLEQGLIAEVKTLLQAGLSKEILTFYGLEYKFVVSYLCGGLSYPELRDRLGTAICQFAKRQMTFFRKMEKDGVKIHWLDTYTKDEELLNGIISLYQNHLSI